MMLFFLVLLLFFYFEYAKAWVEEQIIHAQKRVSDELNFDFFGENAASQAGHIADMTKQLRAVLFQIRVDTQGFQVKQYIHPWPVPLYVQYCTSIGFYNAYY